MISVFCKFSFLYFLFVEKQIQEGGQRGRQPGGEHERPPDQVGGAHQVGGERLSGLPASDAVPQVLRHLLQQLTIVTLVLRERNLYCKSA